MTQLRRELGLWDLVLLNIAAVVSVRWIAAAAHIGPSSVVLWVLAVVFYFLPCALAVTELATRFPGEGGYYLWTREAFGEFHAFACGWMAWWSNLVFFPNLALAIAGIWFGENRLLLLAGALAVFWLVIVAHLVGLRIGKWTQNVGGAATWLAGLLLIGTGLVVWNRHGSANAFTLDGWSFEKLNFGSQIALALVGIELGAIMGAEVRHPQRDIPRAALLSSFLIAGIFILGTAALLVLVPAGEVNVITGIVQGVRVAGKTPGALMAVLVTVGLVGNLSSWVAGSSRLPFVIGVDRHLPVAFGRLHPRFGTPHVALLVAGVAGTALLLLTQVGETARGAYLLLVDLTVVATMIPYLYLFASLLALRRDPARGSTPEHILAPGGRVGLVVAGGLGLATTSLALILSLVPPPGVRPGWFVVKTLGGTALALLVGLLLYRRGSRLT